MNIALTRINAVANPKSCGRHAFVRPLVLGCALAFGGMSAVLAGPADAPPGAAAQQMPRDSVRNERMQPAPPRQVEASRNEQRERAYEARADEQRRQMQQEQAAQNAEAARRSGRLTADERRDLRRQINEAGIDLYPNTPRR